jgi:hypothetical protein
MNTFPSLMNTREIETVYIINVKNMFKNVSGLLVKNWLHTCRNYKWICSDQNKSFE